MARTPEFEDMRDEEWPEELRKLRRAAVQAYYTYAELDAIHTGSAATTNERVTMYELIGRAGALLRDLRAEGMRQLAEWEESQKTDEEEYQRKRIENWNAVADGLQPPHPSDY